jgi:flavin reductase (DIM6/NTAB) family NADH-FMN oxidoreductase RutF
MIASESLNPSDRRSFRSALGRFASGLTVITCRNDDRLDGMTCQSFASVSLEPPLISICLTEGSATLAAIDEAGSFCVNVLAEDQQWLSDRFGRPHPGRWHGMPWSPTTAGHPALAGCLAWLGCEPAARVPAGDHVIIVAAVRELRLGDPTGRPLLYFSGDYAGLTFRAARAA